MSIQRATAADELPAPVRCAIYTRKSTDEGLDQDFNSLDAQRESAELYIASQRQNGMILVPDRYDDGGFTGGNLERPALQRLLKDIETGKVQCVVVYKIDRLSRSLLDFTRLIDLFDRHGASFISVTQQFSTTNSMGRLTLNILLSFAQFEREIIAERIRDKVSAAKRKGKYMGGPPVLGYDADPVSKRLFINEKEADIVRRIYKRVLETGSPQKVTDELNEDGITTKSWTTRTGHLRHGKRWNRAFIYRMLHNRLYIGQIEYRGNVYEAEHEAIVTRKEWEQAQALLKDTDRTKGNRNREKHNGLLRGLLACRHCNCGMSHSFIRKGPKLYRYYICMNAMKNGYASCELKSVPAGDLEQIVFDRLKQIFHSPAMIVRAYRQAVAARVEGVGEFSEQDVVKAFDQIDSLWSNLFPGEQARIAKLLVKRITISLDELTVELRPEGLLTLAGEVKEGEGSSSGEDSGRR